MINEIDPVFDEIKRKNLVVFDVGANTGLWSKALLEHSDELIEKLYLFEPLIGNYNKILERKQAGFFIPNNEKMKIFNNGISDQESTLILNYDADTTGYASLVVKETLMGPRSVSLDHKVEIDCFRIEDVCNTDNISQIDFLKIDVEGHEWNVLKGAESLIKAHKIKNIIFEFGTHQLFANQQFKMFWDFFEQYKYKMYLLRGGVNGFGKVPISKYSTVYENFSQVRMFYVSVEHLID
jgi:FkbM family methyltransferase